MSRGRSIHLMALGVIVCCACGGSAVGKGTPAPPPAPVVSQKRNVEKVEAFATKREVYDVVQGWSWAVSQHDLAKLRALYATDAAIVLRRNGEAQDLRLDEYLQLVELDMRTRVEARFEFPLDTTSAPASARVRHRFSWTSASSNQRGVKELTLVRIDGALRIAKDEIVESKVLRSNDGRSAFGGTALVSNDVEPRALVGFSEVKSPDHGPISVEKGSNAWVVNARTLSDIPAGIRAWHLKSVRILHESGDVCRGALSELEYTIHLTPEHAEQALVIESTGEARPGPTPMDPALEASLLWNEARVLPIAGRVQADTHQGCEGKPLLVRMASAPADRIARPVAVPRQSDVMAAFRALPEYSEMQAAYEREVAGGTLYQPTARWDDRNSPTLRAFRFEGASETLVSLTLGASSCGDWTPSSWAVFAVHDSGAIDLHRPFSYASPDETLMILDAGSDGRVEYVGRMLNGQLAFIDSSDDTLDMIPADWPPAC